MRAHSLTLSYTFLHSRECVVTPGLPLGPHPSNAFVFVPRLPSFWLATLPCLCLDSRASSLLGPQPCNPFALVASPKLGLRQSSFPTFSSCLLVKVQHHQSGTILHHQLHFQKQQNVLYTMALSFILISTIDII